MEAMLGSVSSRECFVRARSSPPPEDRGRTETPKAGEWAQVQREQQKSTTKSINKVKLVFQNLQICMWWGLEGLWK